MPTLTLVDTLTQRLRSELQRPAPAEHFHDTAAILYSLLHNDRWQAEDRALIEQLARRLDIGRKLRSGYGQDWKVPATTDLSEPWISVAALVLYQLYRLELDEDAQYSTLLKRINALLKALQITQQDWSKAGSELQRQVLDDFHRLIKQPGPRPEVRASAPTAMNHADAPPKTLPITVLFYEGPIARAYLETIRAAGFRPEKIIQLIAGLDVATHKPVGRLLPTLLRQSYAASLQRSKIHHWPQRIASTHAELCQTITSQVAERFQFPQQSMEDARALKPLQHYCDNIEPLLITGLKDQRLHDYLSALPPAAILFTGGGIVPASLLEIDGLRFIHVHPGYLPAIRGADCVLWSALLAGHSSASSFYMSPGIDAGDIIQPHWLPKIEFAVDVDSHDLKTLYRAIYSFFDPWVRAFVLRETLIVNDSFMDIDGIEQCESDGTTFHFMHPRMQRVALESLFQPPSDTS